MTLIIVKEEQGTTTMVADHCVTLNYPPVVCCNPAKILKGINFLIGSAGDGLTGNMICRKVKDCGLPDFTNDDNENISILRDFLSKLHKDFCGDFGFLTFYIIAYNKKIFYATWNGELTCTQVKDNYFYIGAVVVCNDVIKKYYPNGFLSNDMPDIIDKVSENPLTGVKCWGPPLILSMENTPPEDVLEEDPSEEAFLDLVK